MTPRRGRLQITFDCHDPERLAAFWAGVLGYPPLDIEAWRGWLRSSGDPEADLNTWCVVEDPAGAEPRLSFQSVPEPKVTKNRIHLDLTAPTAGSGDRRQQIDAEVARILGLGATSLCSSTNEAEYFVVLQDPEGNEFCVG